MWFFNIEFFWGDLIFPRFFSYKQIKYIFLFVNYDFEIADRK